MYSRLPQHLQGLMNFYLSLPFGSPSPKHILQILVLLSPKSLWFKLMGLLRLTLALVEASDGLCLDYLFSICALCLENVKYSINSHS